VAHSAWHWMSERWGQLQAYSFYWPALDRELFVALMRWAMLLLILTGAVWLLFVLFGRFGAAGAESSEPSPAEE